jgi:hypothetical protein
MTRALAVTAVPNARFHRPYEFPPTHQREFQMSTSVTKAVPSVASLSTLLSGLGFDVDERKMHLELVIDKFDQWGSPENDYLATCISCTMQIAS